MALTYQLPEGMVNADLPQDDQLFSFLCTMMLTKVGKLDGKGLADYKVRIAQYLVVANASEDIDYYYEWADNLAGLHTNITTETNAKWKAHLWQIVQDRASDLQRSSISYQRENA